MIQLKFKEPKKISLELIKDKLVMVFYDLNNTQVLRLKDQK